MILKGLGVKDVKVQELFTLDQDSLDILPYASFKVFQREATDRSQENLCTALSSFFSTHRLLTTTTREM